MAVVWRRYVLAACSSLAVPWLGRSAEDERAALTTWFEHTFLGQAPAVPAAPGLAVRRQDHGSLGLRKSALQTPLQLGTQRFEHGLGTHAVSEIVVVLAAPGQRLTAQVGIDRNDDTQGQRGSVIFVVEVAGKEVFRSGVCRGGDAPVALAVDLHGATTFTLRVLDGGDGPGWDQADWADAAVTFADGKQQFLDELPLVSDNAPYTTALPFSFTYDGRPAADLLPTWRRTVRGEPPADGRQRHVITWTDPATGLEVRCEATTFAAHPAIEWVLFLRQTGAADSPIIEAIRPLDLGINAPAGNIVLHHAHGSTCTATDFLPLLSPVNPKSTIGLAPRGGRSSDGALPFFNLEWSGGGLVGAIGWSGQWALKLERNDGSQLRLEAGQQTTHLRLHPGESIRTPRMLVVAWQGSDRLRGHNLLRQVLLAHYVPRLNGEVAVPPVTQNTWFVYDQGNATTEENQFAAMPGMAAVGVEGYWLDAGWFEGGWPAGAGSWVPKKEAFPRGLKPIGDQAHELGLKFVLWFEPERVTRNSRIAKEHPEWVLHAANVEWDALYNLGNPDARVWLTNYLSQCIGDWGINIYRNDFNIDPLRFWQAADAPDRQGLAEIRYLEGLYALWDDLRRRHPGLLIDDCASGGRRIDLEMISRSFPLWQSDTQCCGRPMPVWDQVQNAGLSLYVPLHAAGVWAFDAYHFRSIATTGCSLCPDLRQDPQVLAAARERIAEAKALRPYYLGDYYPLLDIVLDEQVWCGWQYDRPDLGQGFVMLFRRAQSPYTRAEVALHGLDPQATYRLRNCDIGTEQTATGAELAKRLSVEIPTAPGSVLLRYQRQ